MADVLIYWRDCAKNWPSRSGYWHSSAKCVAELQPGDRMWMVTSGKAVRQDPEHAAFLVAVRIVREVIDNPDDDPAYPAERYRKRVLADPSASVVLNDPVLVDHIVRPPGRDKEVSIGMFLRGPRRLSEEKVRLLRAAAGAELAAEWLRSGT